MYSFEIFTLDKVTMCHDKELYISMEYGTEDYDKAVIDGKAMGVALSLANPNDIVEVNVWDSSAEEWTEEFAFLNGDTFEN